MSCQILGDVRPAVNRVFWSISLCMASGVEVEAVLIVKSVRLSGGGLCFFLLGCRRGAQSWEGAGCTALACGMWDGPRFLSLFSLLFLEGVVGISLPDLVSMRHCICRACFLLGATSTAGALEVVARRTPLGMNLKVAN